MRLWQSTHRTARGALSWVRQEAVGTLRSLRYDMARRRDPGRARTEIVYPEYDAYQRPRRRGAVVLGFSVALVASVTGLYLAVSGGIGALLDAVTSGATGTISGAAPRAGDRQAATPAPSATLRAHPPLITAHGHPIATPSPAPIVVVPPLVVAAPSCLCPAPPVPTPTSPGPAPSPSPSPSPSPTPPASPSLEASRSPTADPTP